MPKQTNWAQEREERKTEQKEIKEKATTSRKKESSLSDPQVRITFVIPQSLRQSVKMKSVENNESMSAAVRRALESYVSS